MVTLEDDDGRHPRAVKELGHGVKDHPIETLQLPGIRLSSPDPPVNRRLPGYLAVRPEDVRPMRVHHVSEGERWLGLGGYLLQPAQSTPDVVRIPAGISLEEGKRRGCEEGAAKIGAGGSTGRIESSPGIELPICIPVSNA